MKLSIKRFSAYALFTCFTVGGLFQTGSSAVNAETTTRVHVYQVNGEDFGTYTSIKEALKKADGNHKTVLELLDPEYEEFVTIDKANVTLKSEDSEHPATFVGKDIKDGDKDTVITITAPNVTVDSVDVTGLWLTTPSEDTNPVGIRIKANDVTINNCKVYNMGCKYTDDTVDGTGFNAHGIICSNENFSSEEAAIKNPTVTNCELYGLILGNSEALVMNGNVTGFNISNNIVHDCDNIGIDIIGYEKSKKKGYSNNDRARSGVVKNNIVYNISSGENLTYREDQNEEPGKCAGGIYVDGGYDVTIDGNYVENCDIGVELASEHGGQTTDKITLTNNILINNNALGGISIGGSSSKNGNATNLTIQNNTVYNTAVGCFRIQKADCEDNDISKNIFIAVGKNVETYEKEKEAGTNNIHDNYITKKSDDYPNVGDTVFVAENITFSKNTGTISFDHDGYDLSGYGAKATDKPDNTNPETSNPDENNDNNNSGNNESTDTNKAKFAGITSGIETEWTVSNAAEGGIGTLKSVNGTETYRAVAKFTGYKYTKGDLLSIKYDSVDITDQEIIIGFGTSNKQFIRLKNMVSQHVGYITLELPEDSSGIFNSKQPDRVRVKGVYKNAKAGSTFTIGGVEIHKAGTLPSWDDGTTPIYDPYAEPKGIAVTYYDGIYSRGFAWSTSDSISESYLYIIEKIGNMNETNVDWSKAAKIKASMVERTDEKGKKWHVYKAHVKDLKPNATYLYKVGRDKSGYSTVGTVKIEKEEDEIDGVSFIHLTDCQEDEKAKYDRWANVLKAGYSTCPDASFVSFTGDLTNLSEDSLNMYQWIWGLDAPSDILRNVAISPSSGNHDQWDYSFTDRFDINYADFIPDSDAELKTGGCYYYTYGEDILFINMNTNDDDDSTILKAQKKWLTEVLESHNDYKWKVVQLHKGPMSTGRHSTNGDVKDYRDKLCPIFSKYKVDLVLQGHDHVYTRTASYKFSDADNYSYEAYDEAGVVTKDYEFDGEKRIWNLEPIGTHYVTINYCANKKYDPITDADERIHIGINPISEDNGCSSQPQKPMYGVVRIKGDVLCYDAYTYNSETKESVLFDTFSVNKGDNNDQQDNDNNDNQDNNNNNDQQQTDNNDNQDNNNNNNEQQQNENENNNLAAMLTTLTSTTMNSNNLPAMSALTTSNNNLPVTSTITVSHRQTTASSSNSKTVTRSRFPQTAHFILVRLSLTKRPVENTRLQIL